MKDVTRIESLGEGRFRVHGALVFGTVTRLFKESRKRFAGQKRLLIDLSTVAESDSAGLALLVEWLRVGKKAGQEVWFTAIPAPIVALSRIGEVDDLLQSHVVAEDEGEQRTPAGEMSSPNNRLAEAAIKS